MAQQPSSQNSSIFTDEMLFVVFIGLILVALWFTMHTVIVAFYSALWFSEMLVIGLFTDNLALIKDWMHKTPFGEVSFSQFWSTSGFVGYYSRFFWAPVMIGVGVYAYLKDPSGRFKKIHNTDSLMRSMRKLWPHASMLYEPDVKKNTVAGIGLGPALKSREFAKKYELLDDEDEVIEDLAEDIFTYQLGAPFYGVYYWEKRPQDTYKLALVTLCILKFNREATEFILLRNRLAEAFHKHKHIKSEYPLVIEMYKKHKDSIAEGNRSTLVAALEKKHAYEYTFLYALFGKSKRAIFAPNEFAWLKVVNRTLWYTLNSVHRRVAWTEAAGPKAHYLAEALAQKPIKTPMVTEAVAGLKEGVREILEKELEA